MCTASMALSPGYRVYLFSTTNSSQSSGNDSLFLSSLPLWGQVLYHHHSHASSEYSAGVLMFWDLLLYTNVKAAKLQVTLTNIIDGSISRGKAVDLFKLTEIALKLASGPGRFHCKREQRQNELITAFTQCQVLKEFNCFSAIGLLRYVYSLHDGRVVKK